MTFKQLIRTTLTAVAVSAAFALPASAKTYQIDTKGAHAFIQFKIKHMGFSWLSGRFNKFEGSFEYDAANPNASSVNVDIDVASIDSMHAERDKHLRGDRYLDTKQFPKAKFVSSSYTDKGDGKGELKGQLTLHGVTKEITMDVEFVGSGKSPWGKGQHAGFTASTALQLKDFGMNSVGSSAVVYMTLDVEGISQ